MKFKTMLIWALRSGQTKALIHRAADTASQLDKFNAIWRDAVDNVPFYAEWAKKYHLPIMIKDLSELKEWPVLEKKELILHKDKLIRKDMEKYGESVTGGATGEPLHFRAVASENDEVSVNKWIGWARLGVYPDSKCFLLWGHRHFYGQGWRSNFKFKIRQVKDWVTNNQRADATDLSAETLRSDYREILKFRPVCIIAYSASLLALVRTIRQGMDAKAERKKFRDLRAIICTAGPLTKEERGEIQDFFGAPVAMEYGSMEAGVIAYQTPATRGRYQVFEKTHVVHVLPEKETGNSQVLVTKLYKSYLPLIRYKIGDYINDECINADGTVSEFAEVYGRVGDEVDMGDGTRFHGQSFMTCAEGFDKIIAYQLRVNRREGRVTFVAQVVRRLSEDEKAEIIKRAAHMSGLQKKSILVEESSELEKAPSGKIRLVIEED